MLLQIAARHGKTNSWIDASGAVRQASIINDVLQNVGSETDPSLNKRHPMLTNAIIPVKDSAGNHWTVSDPTSFSSDSDGHVIFPDVNLIDIEGHEVIVSGRESILGDNAKRSDVTIISVIITAFILNIMFVIKLIFPK